MKALILAAGFGTRLKEVIHDRPKPMAPINGRPFLEYLLEILRKNGIDEVIIAIGFLGDYIRDYFGDGQAFGLKISYSESKYPLGTAGTIKMAQSFFKNTFLVVNGDTHLDIDLQEALNLHQKNKAKATVVLAKRKITQEIGMVLRDKFGKIVDFLEKPEGVKEGWVNCGYYIFEPEILTLIEPNKKVSLEKEIFPRLAKKGILYGVETKKDFLDIGTPENYRLAQRILPKRRKIVKAWAPARISFAGGGTDLPAYFFKRGGCVVSGTINRYVQATIKTNETSVIKIILSDYQKEETYLLGKSLPYDGGFFDLYRAVINRFDLKEGLEINIKSDFPVGSGLGSSAAVAVALIGAILKLKGKEIAKEEVAQKAIEIEREILKIPGGWQDQYAIAYGGLNFIEFLPNKKVRVIPLSLSKQKIGKLEKNLLLFFLANKRSEKSQQEYLIQKIEKEEKTKEALDSLKKISIAMRNALERGGVEKTGDLLHQAWLAKRNSSDQISNSFLDQIYKQALEDGAHGGKLLGAGGGGCFLLSVSPDKQVQVIKSLESKGARLLPFEFEFDGLRVEAYEN